MASVSFTTMREKTNKKVSEALAYHVIMERLRSFFHRLPDRAFLPAVFITPAILKNNRTHQQKAAENIALLLGFRHFMYFVNRFSVKSEEYFPVFGTGIPHNRIGA